MVAWKPSVSSSCCRVSFGSAVIRLSVFPSWNWCIGRAGILFGAGQLRLRNREQVLHSPIKRQARRIVVEDEQKDQRHVLHHSLLGWVHARRRRRQPRLPKHRYAHQKGERIDRKVDPWNKEQRIG